MKIFLDTADIEEIKRYKHVINGVTTNPTLMNRAGLKYNKKNIRKVCNIVPGPVSVEVVSTGLEDFIKEAEMIDSYADNIVIKVPMTDYGLEAVKELKKKDVKTNVTLVFSANQALLAAKSGANYVSPFVGRLDDIGHDGMALVEDILRIYKNYDFKTEVIVASVRHPLHVIRAAKMGAHIATVPPNVLGQMYKHSLTDTGIERFLEDYKKLNKEK